MKPPHQERKPTLNRFARHGKRYLYFLLTALSLLSACGAPAAQPDGGTSVSTTAETIAPPEQAVNSLFGIPYRGNSGAINPITEEIPMNRDLYSLMFDTLFRVDPQFQPEYNLCTEAVFDGTTLRLTIRDGVRFHDGSVMTAEDVVYSLNLAMEDEDSRYLSRFKGVSAVEADGSGHVVITLEETRPSFLSLLDIPIIKRNSGRGADAVGSGRYRMMEADGQRYLVPNTEHFTGRSADTQMLHMLLTEAADDDALVYGVASGNIDIVKTDALDSGTAVLRGNMDRYRVDTSELLFIGFQTRSGLFADKSVRQAAAALLAAADICGEALSDGAVAAPDLFHPALGYTFPDGGDTAADLSSAVSAAGGYRRGTDGVFRNADGSELTLRLLVNGDAAYAVEAAAYMKALFAEAGLSVEIREETAAGYEQALQSGGFELYFGAFDAGADFDFTGLLHSNGVQNRTGLQNTDLDALLDAYVQAGTADGEMIARQLAEKVGSEAAIVPVGYRCAEVLLNRKFGISNVTVTDGDIFYNIYDWLQSR